MFKYFALVCLFIATATTTVHAGLIATHHLVHEPVLAKVGHVVHSAPSAVSHQSITQVHSKSVVEPVLAHGVKTTIHSAPVVPVVHHVAPVVHSVPLVHSVPVVKSIVSHPVAYSIHH